MTVVLVDTSVLIDVLTGDAVWGAWSGDALADAMERATLVVNPIVYGELSIGFRTIQALDEALPAAFYRREAIPYAAAFLAAKAIQAYRERGGTRTPPLADFYIGAHAAVAGYQLLTRDLARYRTSFPRLAIIGPGT